MPTPIVRYRKRPITIDTILWDGTNTEAVQAFCGTIPGAHGTLQAFLPPGDGRTTALVHNTQEQAWIPAPIGHVIARGALGELYPISPAALAATYETAEA